MARCAVCSRVHRKAKGESWFKLMCNECYTIIDFFTWGNRWHIESMYRK